MFTFVRPVFSKTLKVMCCKSYTIMHIYKVCFYSCWHKHRWLWPFEKNIAILNLALPKEPPLLICTTEWNKGCALKMYSLKFCRSVCDSVIFWCCVIFYRRLKNQEGFWGSILVFRDIPMQILEFIAHFDLCPWMLYVFQMVANVIFMCAEEIVVWYVNEKL